MSSFALAIEEMVVGYAYLATAVELKNATGFYFDETGKPLQIRPKHSEHREGNEHYPELPQA